MRRGDENDPRNLRPTLEDQSLGQQRLSFRREICLVKRLAEIDPPYFVAAGIRDHEPADNATHAVADEDNWAVTGEDFVQRVEFAPKQQRRVRHRISARVTENPELIISAHDWISPQLVDHRCPGGWRGLKAVNKEDRNLSGIVRLESRKPRLLCEFLRGQLGLHGDERRARPLPSIPREDKFATHIEFVRRDQVELLWFPKPVGMWMMGEHVFAAARCGHVQRTRPRIEMSVSDYRKH